MAMANSCELLLAGEKENVRKEFKLIKIQKMLFDNMFK